MRKVIGLRKEILVIGKKKIKALAKFDTGAKSTSVDMKIAAKAMIGPVVKTVKIVSASRKTGQKRVVVRAILKISDKEIKAEVNLVDRGHSKAKVLIGRDIIRPHFIIDVGKEK